MARSGYLGTTLVHLNGCETCGLLWLDRGAPEAMCRVWLRTEERVERQRASSAERVEEFSHVIDVVMVSQAIAGVGIGFSQQTRKALWGKRERWGRRDYLRWLEQMLLILTFVALGYEL